MDGRSDRAIGFRDTPPSTHRAGAAGWAGSHALSFRLKLIVFSSRLLARLLSKQQYQLSRFLQTKPRPGNHCQRLWLLLFPHHLNPVSDRFPSIALEIHFISSPSSALLPPSSNPTLFRDSSQTLCGSDFLLNHASRCRWIYDSKY